MRARELFRFSPTAIFLAGFVPPLVGAIASITVALWLHRVQISNYNWQCGKAFLPSLSRIINLPLERTFWQLFTLFHVPMRLVEIAIGFNRYRRLRSVDCRSPRLHEVARYAYLICGVLEIVFLVGLSAIGERESIRLHVIFFYIFGAFGLGFFAANTVCHANSLYYLNPYGKTSYNLKITIGVLYVISVPILLGSFLLYWKKCITFMYEVFALSEYVDVFLNIAFHGCAFLDIRHKVIFSVQASPKSAKAVS
uniref:Frag1/DRAM/Sfk1 family-domain-containing protein n=1 Tax=Steinernema glaseri TaxID=37863 RepID=A0A1I7ZKN9_9BILA